MLGMRASDYRAGGLGVVIRFAVAACSLGAMFVAQSQLGICAIVLNDDPERLVRDFQDQLPRAELIGGDAEFEQLIAQVVGLIEAPGLGLSCLWMCVAQPFSSASGKPCARPPR